MSEAAGGLGEKRTIVPTLPSRLPRGDVDSHCDFNLQTSSIVRKGWNGREDGPAA